jgi:hypothetical protein
VLAAEGIPEEANHELAAAERFIADQVATVHHPSLLVLLARVRARRGRAGAEAASDRASSSGLLAQTQSSM